MFFLYLPLQNVAPIADDGDGHLAYKLGDVIEHENQRCKCENYKQNMIIHSIIILYNFKIFSLCFTLGSWELDRVNDALRKLQDILSDTQFAELFNPLKYLFF